MKELNAKQQANIKQYFDQHTTAAEFHFTSDGQCFKSKGDAENHAKHLAFHKLGTDVVTTYTREEVAAWKTAKATGAATTNNETKPYSEWERKALLDECAKRNVEYKKNMSNAKVIEVLEADDAKKQEAEKAATTEE